LEVGAPLPTSDDAAAFIESDGAEDVLVRIDANYCLHASYSSQNDDELEQQAYLGRGRCRRSSEAMLVQTTNRGAGTSGQKTLRVI
jgi:hypothetical protein